MNSKLVDFISEQAKKAYPNPELDPYALNEELKWKIACDDENKKRLAYMEGAMMILDAYGIENLPGSCVGGDTLKTS